MHYKPWLLLPTLLSSSLAQLSSCPQKELSYKPPLTLPGFQLTKIADGLKHPRQITVDTHNHLLISSLGDGIIALDVTYDKHGCPSAKKPKVVVPDHGLNFTHAVTLSKDGKSLYASTPDVAMVWEYDSEKMEVKGEGKVLVRGMALPNSLSVTRAMAIPRGDQDTLLVFRGEFADDDYAAGGLASGRAMIKAFSIKNAPKGGYNYILSGYTWVTGVRDTLEFDEDTYGNFWNVDNGADAITRDGKPIGALNPADELNFLGKAPKGRPAKPVDFGFPYCHAVWDTTTLTSSSSLHVGRLFSTNRHHITDAQCQSQTQPPTLSLYPHSAPLGIKFYNPSKVANLGSELRGSAFVSYHGPTGHKVVFVPFSRGRSMVPSGSKQAAVDFVWTDPSVNLTQCKSESNNGPSAVGCIAPVGIAYDDRGRLYFTSDQSGEVFAVTAGSD